MMKSIVIMTLVSGNLFKVVAYLAFFMLTATLNVDWSYWYFANHFVKTKLA